jgi:hypothetical protein
MRQRLSWTEKKADPYTMNQQHVNNPVEKYKTFDTTMGEDPDMRHPWEQEGRTETGHPAPIADPVPGANAAPAPMAPAAPAPMAEPAPMGVQARDAVIAARKLEDKALKCITIAQRMLPGASDDLIEVQATDLMYMPERCVLATLQRQAELAEKLASDDKDEDDDGKDKPEGQEPAAPAAAPIPAPVQAADDKKDEKKDEKEPVADPAAPAAPMAPAAPAAPAPMPVQATEPAPAVEPEEKKPEGEEPEGGEMKTASDADLLDMLFNDEPKMGAKKLSGIVKQASTQNVDLDNLWDAPPDVSKAFSR